MDGVLIRVTAETVPAPVPPKKPRPVMVVVMVRLFAPVEALRELTTGTGAITPN